MDDLSGLYTLLRRMLCDQVDLERRVIRLELSVFLVLLLCVGMYVILFWSRRLSFVAW